MRNVIRSAVLGAALVAVLALLRGPVHAAPMFTRESLAPEVAPAPAPAPTPVAAPPVKPRKAPAPKPKVSGRKIRVMAYAYALHGYTASGAYTRHGTIAVDTRVIPFGSRIFVPGYGWGIAQDTGGAIQGNKIDLWMPTTTQCYQWGVRSVDIIIEPPYRAPLASRKGKPRPKK